MAAESDWRGVRNLCARLLADMDALAPAVTAQIRIDEPAYAVVPLPEHIGHVHEQQVRLLEAIAERRVPDAEDLHRAALLGRRRATQGLPVQAVIGAYHVGNRELWDLMRARPGAAARLLPDVAALMWSGVQLITATIAQAHSDVVRAQQADQITLRHRLVELLRVGETGDETTQIARTLGFDPDGRFVALAVPGTQLDSDELSTLRTALDALPGSVVIARSQEIVAVVAQVRDSAALQRAIGRVRPHITMAFGLPRTGLGGAALSLRDASRVLAAAGGREGSHTFEDEWLHAVLLSEAADLRALIGPMADTVRANRHLADAVVAFAEHDLSASGAARALGLHPNTTLYRLGRWQELTGWDPRTFSGLSLSLLACWLTDTTDRTD